MKNIAIVCLLVSCLTANFASASNELCLLYKAQDEVTSLRGELKKYSYNFEKMKELQRRVEDLEARLCEDGFDMTNNKAKVYVFGQVMQLLVDVNAELKAF